MNVVLNSVPPLRKGKLDLCTTRRLRIQREIRGIPRGRDGDQQDEGNRFALHQLIAGEVEIP